MKGIAPKVTLCVLALIFAAAATAAVTQPESWTKKDMTAAAKAVGYPKAHPKTASCSGIGAAVNGRFDSFRCSARYKTTRQFYLAGDGEGGWICAGTKLASCKLLPKGFVSTSTAARYGGLNTYVSITSAGYVEDKTGQSPSVTSPCAKTTGLSWSCGFTTGNVTVTYKTVRGGWTIRAS